MVLPFMMPIYATSTTSLSPTADAYVDEANPNNNYGSASTLDIGEDSNGNDDYIYIRFDLSGIPSDAVIVSAELKLYAKEGIADGKTVKIYRVLGDWSETGITWSNKPDNAANETDSAAIPSTNNWMVLDVTGDVEGFVNGSFSNYGWVIKCVDCSAVVKNFASREYSDASKRPKLVVEYVEPNTVTTTVTQTITETQTVTETTTVANTTITETQTETITTTQTINNTVYSTVTTTVANTTYYTTIYETISPAYGNETANYYVDLTNQLMPLIMVIGVICTMLSLLLSATKAR